MSSFDLSRITEALQSTKVKTRSDALLLLGEFPVPKLRLSSLQLASLCSSLIRAIELERDAYVKLKRGLKLGINPTLTRATNASGFLRDLVQETLKKARLLKQRPRLKTCLSLISSILALYYEPNSLQTFAPCVANFSKILISLFETPYVFSHLPAETWTKGYHFLHQAIAYELEFMGDRGKNENLISDLYSALFLVLGGPLTYGMLPLLSENTYFPLLNLLAKTFSRFNKRESPVLVVTFKIIINLQIALASEDTAFIHQLIRISLPAVLQFAQTPVVSLLEQLFIFLNLDSFHRYLSLERLPKLVPVPIGDTPDDTFLDQDTEIVVYNVELLICSLLQRATALALALNPEDIGLCSAKKMADWYNLPCIYMASAKGSMNWLLTCAVSRLIASYYRIRHQRNSALVSERPPNGPADTFAGKSYSTNWFKRQKISARLINLTASCTPAQFYNSLIALEDARLQKCGLQLLAFHYEINGCNFLSCDEEQASFTSSGLLRYNDPTVLNVDVNSGGDMHSDTLSVLSNVVKLVADGRHAFWALLASSSLLIRLSSEGFAEASLVTRKMYQLLKLVLDSVKDKAISPLACAVFAIIINFQSPKSLRCLIDNTMMNQIENTAELSDILGPAMIDIHAAIFWQALAQVYVVLGSRKRANLSSDIAKWLVEKWNSSDCTLSVSQWKESALAILHILLWLGGFETPEKTPQHHLKPPDFVFKAMRNGKELHKFIALEDESDEKQAHTKFSPSILDQSTKAIDSIIESISKSPQTTGESIAHCLSLSMVLVNVSGSIKSNMPEKCLHLEETARVIILSLTPNIQLKDQALMVMAIVLEFDPNQDTLEEVAFPFEILDYHFRFLQNALSVKIGLEVDLDTEFTSGDDAQVDLISLKTFESLAGFGTDQCEYFKFLATFERTKPEKCIAYMAKLPPPYILECLSYYMDARISDLHITDPDVSASLVRLIGEKLLSVADFDRLDSTIEVCTRLLETLMPSVETSDLRKDVSDLVTYFFLCVERHLLTSERAVARIWTFLLCYIRYNTNDLRVSSLEIISVFIQQFPGFLNITKNALSAGVHRYISGLDVLQQALFFDRLAASFSTPQGSTEKGATFCLFLSSVSRDLCLDSVVLICTTPYARFPFFGPYLAKSVAIMVKSQNIENTMAYFKNVRMDLLKNWWTEGYLLSAFPYPVFGYANETIFVADNFRYMTAVLFATRCKPERKQERQLLMKTIMTFKNSDMHDLVRDSLPLMITLAYTPGGIRSDIFAALKTHLGNQCKECIREKIALIVLEILLLTEVQSELALRSAAGGLHLMPYLASPALIRSYMQETIDPPSSAELISALLNTYWAGGVLEFWSVHIVYFLTRRIGLEASVKDYLKLKCALRHLQYLLCLTQNEILDFHLVRLLISICLPMIKNGELVLESLPILNLTDLQSFLAVSHDQSLPLIFDILATVLSLSDGDKGILSGFCGNLELLVVENSGVFGTAEPLVLAALKHFKYGENYQNHHNGGNVGNVEPKDEISLDDVEKFLDDDRNAHLIQRSATEIFLILSKVLTDLNVTLKEHRTTKLAALCLQYRPGTETDGRFRLWVAEYLADFYLKGLASATLDDIVLVEEYTGINKTSIEGACKTLNPFLNLLIQKLSTGTYQEKAFVEAVLGALFSTFQSKKRDVTRLLEFDVVYEHFGSYVMPLDHHSFTLLHPEDAIDEHITSVSVDLFVSNFQDMVVKLPFHTWTCQLLQSLIQECSGLSDIAPILSSIVLRMPDIAKKALPGFVCFYIYNSGSHAVENITKIFKGYWKNFSKRYCQESIDTIKNIALSIRIGAMQNIPNFVKVYSALNHTQLFVIVRESVLPKTALMFFEDSIKEDEGKSKSETETNTETRDWTQFRTSLASLYGSLNDEDSLAGIPGDMTLENSLILKNGFIPSAEKLRYSSGFLDASLILGETPLASTTMQALLDEGYIGASNMLLNLQKHVHSQTEWGWKLNQWDLPADNFSADGHDVTYAYFKQIRDNVSIENEVYRCSMVRLVAGISGTPSSGLNPREAASAMREWLASLALVKSAHSICRSNTEDFAELSTEFEHETRWFDTAETHVYEDILWGRRLAFAVKKSFIQSNDGIHFGLALQGEIGELVRYNNLLRHAGMLQKTVSSAILLEKIVNTQSRDVRFHHQLMRVSSFQTAHTLWGEGKTDISVELLRKLASEGDISLTIPSLNVSRLSISAQLAVWLAESRLDLGANILEQVVEPMKADVGQVQNMQQRCKINHLMAHFCELQYKSAILKEQLMQLESIVASKKDEVQEIKSHYGKSEALATEKNAARLYYDELKNLIKSKSKELATLKELRTSFAHNAVTFYLHALLSGTDTSDEDLDKFFSLFLEFSSDEHLQASIQAELGRLPSSKPLAWCTQILSRVSKEVCSFQDSIQLLLFRACLDHPFHSLYYLTSLLFHEKLAKETGNASMVSRVDATGHIRNKLLGSNPAYTSQYLVPIERLCAESVSLAEVKSTKGKSLHLDKLRIGSFWCKELPQIPPPTLQIPVSNSEGYAGVPFMVQMDPKIAIASSGISLPKVATFLLSNGKTHKMLLKHGSDDLRQDAIMEQVFEKVNKIFGEEKETRKRKLRVRTYSAVPLGPKAGAIEFVLDSKALFEVVFPYHLAMDTMKLDKARELMKNSQTRELKDRLRAYRDIQLKIRPVLKHYFLHHFLTPDAWFASRQIYIRGVATTSMVGHILGLGDRHCNNILLDEFSGEPIHIDLGVAFDQGKKLKVPETVPFRLTRDIVDGFGYMGTSGLFGKVCEHTFRVLRASKDHILSILDVLRWDPLYAWSISPIRKRKLQEENASVLGPELKQDVSAAGTAILGVYEKLSAGGLSVEAAVRELIREAASEKNLAVIYCGWCPFY